MSVILIIIYLVAGYWATGQTIFYNKIVIHKFGDLFIQRVILGALLGIAIIPIAIIMKFVRKK